MYIEPLDSSYEPSFAINSVFDFSKMSITYTVKLEVQTIPLAESPAKAYIFPEVSALTM